MGGELPFYLLEYLGYFPEVSSPPNVLISVNNVADDAGVFINHKFDSEGRLIGFDNQPNPTTSSYPITITWK
jgi:hypothetical protein